MNGTMNCVFRGSFLLAFLATNVTSEAKEVLRVSAVSDELLATEKVPGNDVWVDPALSGRKGVGQTRVAVWFDEQFLGDGEAYQRRAEEFSDWKQRNLRKAVVSTLRALADRSYEAAAESLTKLIDEEAVFDVERHWIVNGFSCTTTPKGLTGIVKLPGVSKVFAVALRGGRPPLALRLLMNFRGDAPPGIAPVAREEFSAIRYKHPWYTRYLLADRVWRGFGVTGKGTLNVIHDSNFVFAPHTIANLYRNAGEEPGNGIDD